MYDYRTIQVDAKRASTPPAENLLRIVWHEADRGKGYFAVRRAREHNSKWRWDASPEYVVACEEPDFCDKLWAMMCLAGCRSHKTSEYARLFLTEAEWQAIQDFTGGYK